MDGLSVALLLLLSIQQFSSVVPLRNYLEAFITSRCPLPTVRLFVDHNYYMYGLEVTKGMFR